jgi:stearoyl-CoA desaturase (delta-9 desaturase)
MFDMNKFWEKFFYIFTWLTQGSSFLSPRAYAILHRMHHAYSDTEKDPHSPHYHRNAFTMMWKTKAIYNSFLDPKAPVEERFSKDIPYWGFVEKLGDNWISRIAWGTGYSIFYIIFVGPNQWYLFLLLPIHFLMGPVHGAIVNWFGHKLGYSNFDNNDKSKNTLVFDLLMGGELFQNNHHKHADSPNFAKKWYEFDPTYPVMKVLNWVRVIKIKPRFA